MDFNRRQPGKTTLIQNAFTDGMVEIVKKVEKRDKFNTPLPNQYTEELIGRYAYRATAINTNDVYEFNSRDVELSKQIRISYVPGIDAGMTAKLGDRYFNIEKAFPDFANQELELLLSIERAYV